MVRLSPDVDRIDALFVFLLPGDVIGSAELHRILDFDRNLDLATRSGSKPQSCVGLPSLGQDEHQRPITTTEDTVKRLFVDATGFRRVTRMRVNPDTEELLRGESVVDLSIEVIGDGFVIKLNGNDRRSLADQPHVAQQQQVVHRTDSKTTHFGVSGVTQKQEFGPRVGSEPQHRRWQSSASPRFH